MEIFKLNGRGRMVRLAIDLVLHGEIAVAESAMCCKYVLICWVDTVAGFVGLGRCFGLYDLQGNSYCLF